MNIRLPLMERYLATLPDGLRSFPDHVQKATVLDQFAGDMGGDKLFHKLPAELGSVLRSDEKRDAWVPEVISNAILLAIRDLAFDSDDAFIEAARQSNYRLFRSPLYRMLMKAISPSFMVRYGESRWRVFHRGIRLRVTGDSNERATVRLSFPPGLVPEVITLASYATAFQCAIDVSGGKSVTSSLVKHDFTSSEFVVAWT